jgi:hypothetical protein
MWSTALSAAAGMLADGLCVAVAVKLAWDCWKNDTVWKLEHPVVRLPPSAMVDLPKESALVKVASDGVKIRRIGKNDCVRFLDNHTTILISPRNRGRGMYSHRM